MYIDEGGGKGLVAKELLYGEKVGAVLIKVGPESVTEGVAGKLLLPSEFLLVGVDVPAEVESVYRGVGAVLFREQIASGLPASIPVTGKDIQRHLRKDGIAVRTVLGFAHMDAHVLAADVVVQQGAAFPDTKTGAIEQ